MDLAVITRDVDRDQETGLTFLLTPRADDFQGGRYSAKSVPPRRRACRAERWALAS
jgi:hypothetical protein